MDEVLPCVESTVLMRFPVGTEDSAKDLILSDSYALTLSTKDIVSIFVMPQWTEISRKNLRAVTSARILEDYSVLVLQKTRPNIYDASLTCIRSLKPCKENINQPFSCLETEGSIAIASTKGNSLLLWDIRTNDYPQLLILPRRTTIHSLSLLDSSLIASTAEGSLISFDTRNFSMRVSTDCIRGGEAIHQITRKRESPWLTAFHLGDGSIGAYDLMSKKATFYEEPPLDSSSRPRRAKLSPVFNGDGLYFASGFSKYLRKIDKTSGLIETSSHPILMTAHHMWSGVYVVTEDESISLIQS